MIPVPFILYVTKALPFGSPLDSWSLIVVVPLVVSHTRTKRKLKLRKTELVVIHVKHLLIYPLKYMNCGHPCGVMNTVLNGQLWQMANQHCYYKCCTLFVRFTYQLSL